MRHVNILAVIASCFLSNITPAQPSRDELEQVAARYKGEDAVMLSSSDQITIKYNDSHQLSIVNHHSHQTYFMSENAKYLSDEQVPYSSFNKISNLHATYYEFIGSRFRKHSIRDIVSVDRYSGSIFYDDNKSLRVVFPNITVGSISNIEYDETYTDPHMLGNFYFSSYIPVDQTSLSIEFPADVVVKYSVFNGIGKLQFKEERLKNTVRYTWTASHLPKVDYDDEDFSIAHYEPHVGLYISSYTRDGSKVDVLPGVGKLYEWLHGFSRDVNSTESPALKLLVDSLVAGKTSDYDKARAIFYWVQSNIKYVAMEEGYSGIKPRDAADIFLKRYGDCKDMSSLQTKMYTYAGLKSHLVWIGTRDIPYTYEQLPTASVNNHMIAAVEIDGRTYFCDGTAYFISLDFPSDAIQGKQALVGIDSSRYEILTVPVMEKERNQYVDSTTIFMDGDTLKGTTSSRYTGYFKFDLAITTTRTPETKLRETLLKMLEKGSNKFMITGLNVPPVARDTDYSMHYSFAIPDYVKRISNSYYVNMNLDRELQDAIIDTAKKRFNKKIDFKHIVTYVTSLRVPQGFRVTQCPADDSFSNPGFGATSHYSFNEARTELTHQLTIVIDDLTVKPGQFNAWNDFINKLRGIYSQVVVLGK